MDAGDAHQFRQASMRTLSRSRDRTFMRCSTWRLQLRTQACSSTRQITRLAKCAPKVHIGDMEEFIVNFTICVLNSDEQVVLSSGIGLSFASSVAKRPNCSYSCLKVSALTLPSHSIRSAHSLYAGSLPIFVIANNAGLLFVGVRARCKNRLRLVLTFTR